MATLRKKICLLGSDGVGKTSIILRFTKNTFSESYLTTLGCDFYEMAFQKGDDRLEVFYWDIASQKNFQKMRAHYLTNSHFVIVCIDIQRTEAIYIEPWIDEIRTHIGENVPFILALNKIDLTQPVKYEKLIVKLQETYNKQVIAVSAKTGENIHRLFETVSDELLMRH
jgi:Ras-related protein Rab-1A